VRGKKSRVTFRTPQCLESEREHAFDGGSVSSPVKEAAAVY